MTYGVDVIIVRDVLYKGLARILEGKIGMNSPKPSASKKTKLLNREQTSKASAPLMLGWCLLRIYWVIKQELRAIQNTRVEGHANIITLGSTWHYAYSKIAQWSNSWLCNESFLLGWPVKKKIEFRVVLVCYPCIFPRLGSFDVFVSCPPCRGHGVCQRLFCVDMVFGAVFSVNELC